jgi:hypothetical protein
MLPNQLRDDLSKLEKIANQQGGKLNLSTILISIDADADIMPLVMAHFDDKAIEIVHSDVEPDVIENYDNIIIPFDPTKINIRMERLTMDSIVKRIEHEEFEFDSEFQRKAGLWNKKQKSQLIESILLKIPLPAFYFDAFDDNKWLIIDGLQRITTIKEFVYDKTMKLSGMEFFKELNDETYDGLTRSLQRRIEETNINAYLVDRSTPLNVKFNIFKRINTGGLTLEPQEIRNALFQGVASRFIKELSESEIFRQVTYGSLPRERMLDREYCLRYYAFSYLPLKDYKGVTDDFLNSAMEKLAKATVQEREEIKQKFERVMSDCHDIMGVHSFRRMANDGRRRPINKTLFESWTHCLYRLNVSELSKLKANNHVVQQKFIKLCEHWDFQNEMKASDRTAVYKRIRRVSDLLREVINNEL